MAKKVVSVQGFAPELLKATADSALAAVNTVGADEQAELVDAWVAGGNVEAVARVAVEDEAPAPARKAARRGLNVLKSRGIRVPDKSTVARPFAQDPAPTLEAAFAPSDGSGITVVSIIARGSSRGTRVADVIIQEGVGVLQAGGGVVSNSRMRDWEAGVKRSRGFLPVPVPLAWARWRIDQARQQNARTGAIEPLELAAMSELIGPPPAETPPHPAFALDLGEIHNADGRVQQSATLHGEPEFRTYVAPRQVMIEVLSNVGKKFVSLESQPDQVDMMPLLRQELDDAVDRFFTPDTRKALGDRLLDGLLSIHHRVGIERARDVMATREAILRAGLITQPPRDIPFLHLFLDKALADFARESQGQLKIPIPQQAARRFAQGPVLSPDQFAAIESARTDPPRPDEPVDGPT